METGEAEFEKVIKITDPLIARGNPQEVAFWLGYRRGIKHRVFGIGNVVPAEEYRCFIVIAEQGHSDKHIEAYARGYLNGIGGKSPCEILGEKGETSEHYLLPFVG